MVRKLENYFDFAENDYAFFMAAYDHHMIANQMGAIAQGICEKYMKHIISEYVIPQSEVEANEKTAVLRTHSLTKLLRFAKSKVPEFEIDRKKVQIIDGYYFTTRYPGDDSISIDEDDIEDCRQAIEECRAKVLNHMNNYQMNRYQEDLSGLPAKPEKKLDNKRHSHTPRI